MRSACTLVCVFSLLSGAVAEVASSASGNHPPLLSHPKGLTADRKSLGALSLKLPPGYIAQNASPAALISMGPSIRSASNPSGQNMASISGGQKLSLHAGAAPAPRSIKNLPSTNRKIAAESRDQAAAGFASNNGNHPALLNHPTGRTADNLSQGARSLVKPKGFPTQTAGNSQMNRGSERSALRGSDTHLMKAATVAPKSWWAKVFGKKDGLTAPERVTAWDIDIESTAVKRDSRLPPPQHRGALFGHGIPAELRGESGAGIVFNFLKLIHLQ